MSDNLLLWCRRKVGRKAKMQSSFASCSGKKLECKKAVPQESPEVTVCFLIAPRPIGTLLQLQQSCLQFIAMAILLVMLLKVFSAYVLTSAFLCVGLSHQQFLNGSALEELVYKEEKRRGLCHKVVIKKLGFGRRIEKIERVLLA